MLHIFLWQCQYILYLLTPTLPSTDIKARFLFVGAHTGSTPGDIVALCHVSQYTVKAMRTTSGISLQKLMKSTGSVPTEKVKPQQ